MIAAGTEQNYCLAHAVGHLEDMSADEAAGIETVLAEIDTQTPQWHGPRNFLLHYVVHPPVKWIVDPVTGTKRYRKFSCVGFVLECYEKGAGIQLLDVDHENFPYVDEAVLTDAYGISVNRENMRERLGIEDAPPWQIALPGYVLHALARPAPEVRARPYLPTGLEEAHFR